MTNRVDHGLGDRTGVEIGQRLANGLGAQHAGTADIGDQDLLGYLALTKSLDVDLLGQARGGGIEGFAHLSVVDFDDEFDSVVVQSGGSCTHKKCQPTAAGVAHYVA